MSSPHRFALAAYVSVCSLSLAFCLSKTQDSSASGASAANIANALPRDPFSSAEWFTDLKSSSMLGVLEALLQTQLGVFVFSNFIIACCAAVAAITTSVFLESLTPLEAGRLTQRLLKYLLFKVVLVGMVVLPSEVQLLHWLPWLAIIGEMKMFVGLAKDRLAGLSVTPTVGLSRHVRTLCLLCCILGTNMCGLALLRRHQGALSWAVSLLFGLDLGIISVEAAKAALSCVSLLMDEALAVSTPSLQLSPSLSGRAMAFWDNWQGSGRERFFYHTELLADMAVHLLTLMHHVHVWLLHGMSFHLLDALLLLDTRVVVVSFVQRVKAHLMHRAATHSLDSTFPDATEKALLADDAECAICRDRLAVAKQLPCGHLFHLPCLRAWLQQSGHDNFKCPICRRALCVRSLRCNGSSADGAGLHGMGAGGAAGGGQQQLQRWGLTGQSPAGLMGHLSLSMSYTDLTAAGRGVRQVSLEEQLLRGVGPGFNDGAAQMDGDSMQQQLQAAASMRSVSSDVEGFDLLLAQALAASLQPAHMPPSPTGSMTAAEDDAAAAAAAAAAVEEDPSIGLDAAAVDAAASAAGPVVSGEAVADQRRQQHRREPLQNDSWQQQQDLAGKGPALIASLHPSAAATSCSSNSSGLQLRYRRACRTASLPSELLLFDCCLDATACQLLGAACDQQHAGHCSRDKADATCWSGPLSDSDVLPSRGHSMRDTCSRVLSSLMHTGNSGSSSSATAGPGKQPHHDSHVLGSRSRSSSSKLGHRNRQSRSCGHLPDVLAAGTVDNSVVAAEQRELPAAAAAAADVGLGALSAAAAAAAGGGGGGREVSSVEQLLLQPRDPVRRRQGGRWGRRRIVVGQDDGTA